MCQLLLSEFETAYAFKDLKVYKTQMEDLTARPFDKPESYIIEADLINDHLGMIGSKFRKSDEEMNLILFEGIPEREGKWSQWRTSHEDNRHIGDCREVSRLAEASLGQARPSVWTRWKEAKR
jgi:hypothetical protein